MSSLWVVVVVVACLGAGVGAKPSVDPPHLATLKPGCHYQGKWYNEGEGNGDLCQPCHCYSGRMACAIIDCFFQPCVDAVKDPQQCCPVCPNGSNCMAPDGTVIPANGTVYRPDANTECSCGSGQHFGPSKALCLHKAVLHTVTRPTITWPGP